MPCLRCYRVEAPGATEGCRRYARVGVPRDHDDEARATAGDAAARYFEALGYLDARQPATSILFLFYLSRTIDSCRIETRRDATQDCDN